MQLAGTALYAPLLVGGLLGGVISDRFDRLKTVRFQLGVLVPVTVLIGILVRSNRIAVWTVYLYMFVVGIGWVTDMTSRRALVFDIVGPENLDRAMALESVSLSSGMAVGALVGGSAVEAVGIGASYFLIAVFLVLALGLLATVKRPSRATSSPSTPSTPSSLPAPSPTSSVRDLVDGVRLLGASRGVVGILGVTVIANFFLFAYFPIVPIVAKRLDASPFQVGLLLSGTGLGMMGGSMLFARFTPHRRGLSYLLGVYFAMLLVIPFALGRNYWLALAAIIASGLGSGLFGSTQGALVIAEAPEELRGRALGLLSMAIGALPLGMYSLGEVAELAGVPAALVANMVIGALVLTYWMRRHPEIIRMTAS